MEEITDISRNDLNKTPRLAIDNKIVTYITAIKKIKNNEFGTAQLLVDPTVMIFGRQRVS